MIRRKDKWRMRNREREVKKQGMRGEDKEKEGN